MSDDLSTDDAAEQSYIVLDSYESAIGFYANSTGIDAKDAIENAIRENGDERLLPVQEATAGVESAFIAVPKAEWNVFGFR